jgi:transposase-like protein
MDVKFLERIAGTQKRLYQFTAIDDCTRIRVLKVYDGCNQRTAIRFMDDVLRRLPFRVHVVQTDNGLPQKSRRQNFSELTTGQLISPRIAKRFHRCGITR